MSIVAITGAAGKLGRATADHLLERYAPGDVVLVSREPASLEAYAARGSDVRHGDFDDPASLAAAFAGVDRVLVISTDALGRRVEQHLAAFDAARGAGVGHVIYTSIPNPAAGAGSVVAAEHLASEEALRSSGLGWTVLRNSLYADMQVDGLRAAIAAGRLVHGNGDGRVAYVSRDDAAAVAAAVLSNDEHQGELYDVTGSEALDGADLARIASAVSGTAVENLPLDDEAFTAALVAVGLPEPAARLYASFGPGIRAGALARPSTVVADLTGRQPQTVAELLGAAVRA